MKTDDLQQVSKVLSPQVLGRLWDSGAFDPRAALGAVLSLPWLVGRGPSLGVLAQINATAYGNRPAIHDTKGTLTWREVDRRTNRLARAFRASGVGSGDRVATLLRNGREAVEAIYAAHKLGVAVAPLNTWGRSRELKHAVEQSSPAVLVYDVRHASALRPALNDGPARLSPWEKWEKPSRDPLSTSPSFWSTRTPRFGRCPLIDRPQRS